jgi:hypothetical protein
MRTRAWRWFSVGLGLLVGLPLTGQTRFDRAQPHDMWQDDASQQEVHWGYPQDWSSRHLLMPGMRAEDVLAASDHDPRYVYNMVMRQVAIDNLRHAIPGPRRGTTKIDWAVSLENGYVPQNQFPAKYQFNVSTENCNSDYVVFGLTVASGTQANVVGINNLYTGASPECNSGSPWVAFAYNTVTQTGGQIKTSPALSADGTKVAFVESTSGGSYFHVLVLPNPIPAPPLQDGTVLSPLTPTSCTKPTTAGCMTTLTIQTSATDSNSSPWIDYNTDTAYVGTDGGILYKITPVFGGGAPALVNDSANWPVTVSTNQYNNVLTAPVVDDTAGLIFLGDGEGYLYSVKLVSPAKTVSATYTVGWVYNSGQNGSGDAGTGVVDPPIAVTDPANPTTDQVFAFTGCSYFTNVGGAITQLPANFTTGPGTSQTNPGNTANLGSASGDGDCTGENVHSGTFDNAFWINGSTSGHIIACGFVNDDGVGGQAEMYMFPFSGGVITNTATATFDITSTKGAAEECSPLTEFYNGTSDMLFFGVGSSSATSYVQSSTLTTSTPYMTTPSCGSSPTSTCVTSTKALGGTSGIVIDNEVSNGGTNIYFSTLAVGSVNGQKCPSGATGASKNPYCAVKLTQSGLQ